MSQNVDISPVVAMIVPGILQLLQDRQGLSLEDASEILYHSALYAALENEETKVWHLGYPILYDLLMEELETGKITWPEEQS
ncbi:MAG: hypothetical protein LBR73_03630 [Oscillospiraceae bacterium]|jgi:hypothetical protein|nr:hypothetical protein [Oscillospiraceae bacterium]